MNDLALDYLCGNCNNSPGLTQLTEITLPVVSISILSYMIKLTISKATDYKNLKCLKTRKKEQPMFQIRKRNNNIATKEIVDPIEETVFHSV